MGSLGNEMGLKLVDSSRDGVICMLKFQNGPTTLSADWSGTDRRLELASKTRRFLVCSRYDGINTVKEVKEFKVLI